MPRQVTEENSLAKLYPDIAAEWHPTRNGDLMPADVTAKSQRYIWWRCKEGHEWHALISNRTRLGRGCPYCAHQKPIIGETDFATTCPELLSEWDYKKNSINPAEVMPGTHKKAWWICANGHEWQAEVKSRVSGIGCPYCAGKRVLKGFNDLETLLPEIAKEWHPTKNGELNPSDVTTASGKNVWWKCKRGHEFRAAIYNRKIAKGCPKCSASLRTSFPEQAIYYYIKKEFPDAINGYREIFDSSMELDIYIPSLKVGIEYDGKVYHTSRNNAARDARKYALCKEKGIMLIRIREATIYSPIIRCDHELEVPDAKAENLDWAINNLCYRLGKIVIPNVKRDRKEILSLLNARNISLTDVFPQIADEWDYDLNAPLQPEQFSPHSNEKMSWKCKKCGYTWDASIGDRTRPDATGCPRCARSRAGKKRTESTVKQKGSLAQLFPEIALEWSTEKNGGISPDQISAGSGKKAWWKCKTCGYEWYTAVSHRTHGRGCPACAGKAVLEGINDLATLYPDVAATWNDKKNDGKRPNQFLPHSGKKVWWLCQHCGIEWEATIAGRTAGHGCPKCRKKQTPDKS